MVKRGGCYTSDSIDSKRITPYQQYKPDKKRGVANATMRRGDCLTGWLPRDILLPEATTRDIYRYI